MNRLEETLKQALRREEPPDGFAERILARLEPPAARPGVWAWLRSPGLRWALAATLPLVLLLAFQYNAERRRRAEGERAKAQMLTALRITADKLEYAREKVSRVTSRSFGVRPANSI
jgi:hypothetical protein